MLGRLFPNAIRQSPRLVITINRRLVLLTDGSGSHAVHKIPEWLRNQRTRSEFGYRDLRQLRAIRPGFLLMPNEPRTVTHIDIQDRVVRESWAQRFSVSDERLRKAVRMVGSRVSSVAAYLGSTVH